MSLNFDPKGVFDTGISEFVKGPEVAFRELFLIGDG